MHNGGYEQIELEQWLENNQSTFIIIGVLLLAIGLILVALKRANLLRIREFKRESDVRSSGIDEERKVRNMQPGLREDRKITEYEKKKMVTRSVISVFEGIVIAIVLLIVIGIMMSNRIWWHINVLMVLFYPVIIGIVIVFALYLSKALICASLDHVIEMCYANQYRAMQYNSSIATPYQEFESK